MARLEDVYLIFGIIIILLIIIVVYIVNSSTGKNELFVKYANLKEDIEIERIKNNKEHLVIIKEYNKIRETQRNSPLSIEGVMYTELSAIYDNLYEINAVDISQKMESFVYEALREVNNLASFTVNQHFNLLNTRNQKTGRLLISEFQSIREYLIVFSKNKVSCSFGACITPKIKSYFGIALNASMSIINDRTANKKTDRLIKVFKILLESIFSVAVSCKDKEGEGECDSVETEIKKVFGSFDSLIVDNKLHEAVIMLNSLTEGDKDLQKTVLLLESEIALLKLDEIKGIRSVDNMNIDKQRMKARLIELKNLIDSKKKPR